MGTVEYFIAVRQGSGGFEIHQKSNVTSDLRLSKTFPSHIWQDGEEILNWLSNETLPKAQRTRGLSSSCQSHIASSNTNLQNLDSASTRNLNQTSASPLNLKFKILTQPSFRMTKIQLHNLYKTSATKY